MAEPEHEPFHVRSAWSMAISELIEELGGDPKGGKSYSPEDLPAWPEKHVSYEDSIFGWECPETEIDLAEDLVSRIRADYERETRGL